MKLDLARSSRRRRPGSRPGVRIRVRAGFEPDTIVATAGRPLRLVFCREDATSSAERVVFPDFGLSAMLPLREDVGVELVPDRPGEFAFACQDGVLRGRLLVSDGDGG